MTTPTVDAPTLAERLGNSSHPNPTLIDVRTPAEFEAGHIPGAVNVPLDELKASLDELCSVLTGHPDIVLVCRSGARAGQAQQALQGAGLASPTVLSGGIVDWEKTGGAVNRGRQMWDLERQVRFAAGFLVLAAVLLSIAVPGAKWLAAFVGGGLLFAALSNTCAMGMALARMPWNRRGTAAASCPVEQLTPRR